MSSLSASFSPKPILSGFMSFMKIIAILTSFTVLGACASMTGGNASADLSQGSDMSAQLQIAALEADIEKLKSQKARLSNEVLALVRQRDNTEETPIEENELVGLPPAPEPVLREATTDVKVTVVDADSLEKTDVPVETAPRLVQPIFASTETVFENEAEGDIKTESILFGVHLASYRKLEHAQAGWRQLQRENPEELGLLEPRIERVTIDDKGVFLRLVGGGFAMQDKAVNLCDQLKSKGLFCSVAGFEGERLSLN